MGGRSFIRWGRGRADADLAAEIEAHLAAETDALIASGMPEDEARRAALRAFGSPLRTREAVREASPRHHIDVLVQDLRYGLRQLRRSPRVTAAVILTLALGISLNSAAFTLLNAILLRSPVTHAPATFVQMYPRLSGEYDREVHGGATMMTLEDFEALRSMSTSLSAVTAAGRASFTLGGVEPSTVRGYFVSCNYIAAHASALLLGRGFVSAECDAPGGQPVAVIGERLWRTRFDGDRDIIGRRIDVNGHQLTIVGVLPNDAIGDVFGPAIWVPYTMQPVLRPPVDYFAEPAAKHAWLTLSGRLAPGISARQAGIELDLLAASLDRLHPGRTMRITVTSGALIDDPGFAGPAMLIVSLALGCVMLILLMVCANVTTLLLARAAARRQEMAVRLSLGASRGRLLRQLLTESLTVSLIAGGISWSLAYWLPVQIAKIIPDFPLHVPLSPDARVFGYTLGLALVAGCAAGVSPALESLRFRLTSALRPVVPGGAGDGGGTNARLRGTLIAVQLAIGLALLVTMGFVWRAQARVLSLNPGFDADHALIAGIDLDRLGYQASSARGFYGELLPRLEAMPGVDAIALSNPALFLGRRVETAHDESSGATLVAASRAVSPAFFDLIGVRVLRGRLFTEDDVRMQTQMERQTWTPSVAPASVIVSDAFVRRFWPGQDGVGQRLRLSNGTTARVVGVVSDTSSIRLTESDGPMLYTFANPSNVTTTALLVHFSGDVSPVAEALRAELRALDARLLVTPETVAQIRAQDAGNYTALVTLTAIPAGLAMVLALMGIYGVTAYAASQRTHEVGVRMAIGAQPAEIIGLFLRSLCWPIVCGLLFGLPFAAIAAAMLRNANLLAGVSPFDPWTYALSLLALCIAADAATLLPARRAARMDPCRALRSE